MNYRERRERRMERRLGWAESRDRKSAAGFKRAATIADGIPLGQPILVGHHSERHARRDVARIDAGMREGCESQDMASHHRTCADTIARQLDSSIYRDDHDAAAQLEARIAQREAERAFMTRANAAWRKAARKGGKPAGEEALRSLVTTEGKSLSEGAIAALSANVGRYSWVTAPFEAFELSNLGGCISRDRKRLEELRGDAEQRARVADALAADLPILIG